MGSGVKLEWIRILSSSFFVLYDLKSISYACPAGCLTFTWSRLSSYSFSWPIHLFLFWLFDFHFVEIGSSFVHEQSPLLLLPRHPQHSFESDLEVPARGEGPNRVGLVTPQKQHCAKKEEKIQIDKCILSQGWSVKHLTEATYCDIVPKKVDTCCTEDRGLGSGWSWGSRTWAESLILNLMLIFVC